MILYRVQNRIKYMTSSFVKHSSERNPLFTLDTSSCIIRPLSPSSFLLFSRFLLALHSPLRGFTYCWNFTWTLAYCKYDPPLKSRATWGRMYDLRFVVVSRRLIYLNSRLMTYRGDLFLVASVSRLEAD